MAITQLKDGRWVVYYVNPAPPPKIKKEYFGRGATAQARAEKRDSELGLKKTRPRVDQNDGPLFVELAIEYMNKGFSPNSKKHLQIRLNANIIPEIGDIPAVKLTHADLERYVKHRRETVKDNTIRREIVDIKAVLNWSVKKNPPLIPYNPVRDYPAPPADDDVIIPPTAEEARAIMEHANERLLRAITISWYTGLRPGAVELLSLTWANVLWDRQVIRVVSAHKGGAPMRDVPIHDDLLKNLLSWREADGNHSGFIVHYRGHRIRSILKPWKQALQKAGITRRLRPYDLRHLFVTRAIEAGVDYKTLSDIVGSSPETLRKHYQHVSNEARRKAISIMPKIP